MNHLDAFVKIAAVARQIGGGASDLREPVGQRPIRWHRLEPAQVVELLAAYQAGTTMADLAKTYGLKRTSVSHLLRRHGVQSRPRRLFSPDDLATASRLYDQGQSLTQIGRRLGFAHKTVANQLKQHGVELRPRPGWD